MEPTDWARIWAKYGGDDIEGEGADVPGVAKSLQLRPDLVVSGAGWNGAIMTLDVSGTVRALKPKDVPVYAILEKIPASSPALTRIEQEKHEHYDATALEKGEVFKAVIFSHSGQMSADAIFAFEVAVKGIAERKGIAPGTVRAWWMGSLCTETAKLTARMLLDAATAAFDTARPGRRRFHPLGDEFNNDLTSAKDVPAQERHVAADGHQRAHSSLLPSAFLQDVRKGCEPRAWDAAEVVADAEAFGGGAVAVPAWG